jgi:TonB-linked SusC/RagA family outer membrane protein
MNKRYILKSMLIGTMLIAIAGRLMAQLKTHRLSSDTITGKNSNPVEVVPGRLFNLTRINSTAAVSSVSGETLYGTSVPNLTNTLYGRLPGLSVAQRSGEPGASNDAALMGIRGVGTYGVAGTNGYGTYKIFVDGFETDDNYFRTLSPAEIESVSVLIDAAALATFGMLGSNGVIYVTTKRGKIGKPTIQFQVRSGLQSAITIDKPLNSYDYANLYNQAISNDNGNVWTPKYTASQLQAYKNGTGTDVDWYNQVLKNNGLYSDADLIFSGGDQSARYNLTMDYGNQQGLYNVPNTGSTSNQEMQRYNLHANLDFNLFKIFEASVDLGGKMEDHKYPNYSTATLWNELASYPSNIYPVHDSTNWSGTTLYPDNPVASVNALGWGSEHRRILLANFSLKERLDAITPGLYLKEAYSFNSYSRSLYNKTATYARYLNGATTTTDITTPAKASSVSPGGQEDWRQGTATLGYEHQFGDHNIVSAVNFHESDYRGDGFYDYAEHYENLSGRANYTYKNRYVGEFGFSYFGTDAYAPGHRWGFYPALSAAWIVSNESFLQADRTISFLKIRASVGKTGGSDADNSPQGQNGRYLYQQYYTNSSPTGGSLYLGDGTPAYQNLLAPLYTANPDIFAEKSIKYNVGIDIDFIKKLDVTMDVFLDKRSNIVTYDNSVPGTWGINTIIKNLGRMTNKGFEVASVYTDKVGKVGYSVSATASYNQNRIDYMAEVTPAHPYNGATGRPYGTQIGLVATGFYQLNDFNADGSLKTGQPVPAFGTVQPGDLKYKDLDNNGVVDANDVTAIGKSLYPRLTYTFGANINYMGFDLGIFLQGTGGSNINLLNSAYTQTVAFVNNSNAYTIAKGAWAYYPDQNIDTRATATYPRLTTLSNANNFRASSFWIKSGDFLRIRNAELGYTFPVRSISKAGINKLRVFVNAANPVTWSTLLKKYQLDPETLSGYPGLKSYNAGVSVVF